VQGRDGGGGDVSKMTCLWGCPADTLVLLIATAEQMKKEKRELVTKRTKYISYLHWAFPCFPGAKINLCICWPKRGSIHRMES